MKSGKSCFFTSFALTLLIAGGIMILVWQQRRAEQALIAYHTAVLAQAPCIENVCPGMHEGRAHTLERLSQSELVRGQEQGTHLIGLLFLNGEEIVGSGGIDFTLDYHDAPAIIEDIAFSLDNLKLESILNTIGEPDQFLFISGCGMGLRVHGRLFYLNQGIEVNIDYVTRRPSSQTLTGDTPVNYVLYTQSDNFGDRIFESLQGFVGPRNVAYDFHRSITVNDLLAQIRPWAKGAAAPTPSADFCPR
jgi:hypothetical protein